MGVQASIEVTGLIHKKDHQYPKVKVVEPALICFNIRTQRGNWWLDYCSLRIQSSRCNELRQINMAKTFSF